LSGKIPRGLHIARGGEMGEVVEMDSKGRVVIPSEIRNKLGLSETSTLVVDIRGEEIVLHGISKQFVMESETDNLTDFLTES